MTPLTPPAQIERLRQAVIDNTKGKEFFWLGEVLLGEIERYHKARHSQEGTD